VPWDYRWLATGAYHLTGYGDVLDQTATFSRLAHQNRAAAFSSTIGRPGYSNPTHLG